MEIKERSSLVIEDKLNFVSNCYNKIRSKQKHCKKISWHVLPIKYVITGICDTPVSDNRFWSLTWEYTNRSHSTPVDRKVNGFHYKLLYELRYHITDHIIQINFIRLIYTTLSFVGYTRLSNCRKKILSKQFGPFQIWTWPKILRYNNVKKATLTNTQISIINLTKTIKIIPMLFVEKENHIYRF